MDLTDKVTSRKGFEQGGEEDKEINTESFIYAYVFQLRTIIAAHTPDCFKVEYSVFLLVSILLYFNKSEGSTG